ncbi:hypothetical protein [Embleya sp. NPDC050493]|uniref:hypothetical protein n=1 Tax=Embleya sp. NPDC050493 TaxID=3363989 RepID=UPI0037876F32
MTYRIQYTNEAEDGLSKLGDTQPGEVRSGAESIIGRDPYGPGSCPVRGDRDRREVTVANAFLRYEVGGTVLVVTVLQAVAPFG